MPKSIIEAMMGLPVVETNIRESREEVVLINRQLELIFKHAIVD